MTMGEQRRGRWVWLLAALLYAVASLYASWGWIGRSFPGFFVLQTGRVDAVVSGDWNGFKAGLQVGDHVIRVDDLALHDYRALYRYVAARPVGTVFRYEVRRSGRAMGVSVASQTFRVQDWQAFHLVFWVVGLIHLLLGAIVLALRPDSLAAEAHWWFCLVIGIFLMSIFGELVAEPWLFVPSGVAQSLIWMTSVQLAACLPRAWPLWERWPLLARFNRVSGWVAAISFTCLYWWAQSYVLGMAILAISSAGCLVLLASTAWAYCSRTSQAQERRQARIILLGAFGAFVPAIAVTVIPHMTGLVVPYREVTHLALLLFPGSVAYAIIRQQLFDLSLVVRRVTLYVLVTAAVGAIYVLVVATATYLLDQVVGRAGPGLPGLFGALVVAYALQPVMQLLRRQVERWFRGARADAEQTLAQFGIQSAMEQSQVAAGLLDVLAQSLAPLWLCLVVDGQVMAERGPLPEAVRTDPSPPTDGSEGDGLLMPLRRGQGGLGWVWLGPRRQGMVYGAEERALVKALVVQAEVALEKARLFEERSGLLVAEGVVRTLADAQRQVLRQVLHDLRSDLLNISVAAERARRLDDPARPIESIHRSVDRIERLLVDKEALLLATKDSQPVVALSEAVADALEAVAARLEAKAQRIEVHWTSDDVQVPLSRASCSQVLTNLLDNASKFAPIRTGMTVKILGDMATVRIQVADEGPGISDALLARLGSGDRADPSIPGLGFGMQNVRTLVVGAGGGVTWWNTGQGAVVEVWLPTVG